MATIFLIEGPVGAGKSTFAAKLAAEHQAVRLILDEWMVNLFSPDRPSADFMPWYFDRKLRCIEQICRVAGDLIDTGIDAVVELGLVQTNDRRDFYIRADAIDCQLEVYVLDAPKAVRQQRVRDRNREKRGTYQMEVFDEIFEVANAAWQPPDDAEVFERNIRIMSTGQSPQT